MFETFSTNIVPRPDTAVTTHGTFVRRDIIPPYK